MLTDELGYEVSPERIDELRMHFGVHSDTWSREVGLILAALITNRDAAVAELASARETVERLRAALEDVDRLVSSGICVIGQRGKDDYIRMIGQKVDAALSTAPAAAEPEQEGS